MKVAFVHCRIRPWWALSVLEDLIDEQKDIKEAKIFTIFSDFKELKTQQHTLKIVTALPRRMNKLFLWCSTHKVPFLSRLFDYRNLIFFYPILMRILSRKIKRYLKRDKKSIFLGRLHKRGAIPGQIFISSFAIAKNITPISGIPMTLYLHSPMQYVWTHYNEYKEKLTGIKKTIFNRIVPRLKERDLDHTKFDKIYANSKYTAQEAKKLYGMQDIIIKYPRIPNKFFIPAVQETSQEYYLYVGRLVNFVRETDKVIKLCNTMKAPLIVMGNGPDEVYLKSIAGPSIIFIGRVKDEDEKIKIISKAKWLINLTKESYGIGTVEALLLGVPIFGYNQWATPELVDKDCGVLVDHKDAKSLEEWFKKFTETKRDRKMIAKRIREKWKEK